MSTPIRVGIVGAGFISAAYLKAAKNFPELAMVSCADAWQANAEKRGEEFGLQVQGVDELLQDKAIDLVLNLTTPQSHVSVSSRALQAGKHVYSEKPLALSRKEAEGLSQTALQHKVRLGCAPDTFLGGGQQTRVGQAERVAVDFQRQNHGDGAIGGAGGGEQLCGGSGVGSQDHHDVAR